MLRAGDGGMLPVRLVRSLNAIGVTSGEGDPVCVCVCFVCVVCVCVCVCVGGGVGGVCVCMTCIHPLLILMSNTRCDAVG